MKSFLKSITEALNGSMDVKFKKIGNKHIFYIDGMVDADMLSRLILKYLPKGDLKSAIDSGEIFFCSAEMSKDVAETVREILRGKTAVIYKSECAIFDTRKTEKRSVSEPSEENSILGSKDSFVEELKTNITLIRKKVVSENLKIEKMIVGKQSNTLCSVMYMNNIADERLIKQVKERISKIEVDGIFTTEIMAQALSERKFSSFPQVCITERPDKVSKNLLQGRVAVFVDGLPICYLMPADFSVFMSTPEDYSMNYIFSSAVRILRYFLLAIEVFLPGVFVALTTFHFEMLPTKLAISIAQSKSGVPFPAMFEILTMLVLFQVLIEAGLHMPKSSGQAVSIVGALVVGEAAIKANFVSPIAVIVVAISVIASFAMPSQELGNALRLWRIVITLLGSIIGLFGVVIGGIFLTVELASMKNFSNEYLSPFVGKSTEEIKNALLVLPDEDVKFRPTRLKTKNRRRRK